MEKRQINILPEGWASDSTIILETEGDYRCGVEEHDKCPKKSDGKVCICECHVSKERRIKGIICSNEDEDEVYELISKETSWEEEFDKVWKHQAIGKGDAGDYELLPDCVLSEIKSFISKTLATERTKFIKEKGEEIGRLEAMGLGGNFGVGFEKGYEKGKTDCLTILKR